MAALEQRMLPSPFATLGVCPENDTLAIFVDERVACLSSRHERISSIGTEKQEVTSALGTTQLILKRRYLNALRLSPKQW